MQYSEFEYQQFVPRPQNRGVRYSWIGEAWDIYRRGFLPWLVLYLVPGCPVLLVSLGLIDIMRTPDTGSGSGSGSGSSPDAAAFLCAVGVVIAIWFLTFMMACSSAGIARRQINGETVPVGEIFQGMYRWIAMYVFSLLLTPLLLLSFAVAGIGIFAAAGIMLPAFGLIAAGESGLRAFSKSMDAMKTELVGASVFCLVFALLAIVGTVLTAGLGALIFIPMMFIISGLAHRDCILPAVAGKVDPYHYLQGSAGVWPPAPTTVFPPEPPPANQYVPPSYIPQQYPPASGQYVPPAFNSGQNYDQPEGPL